MPDLGGLIIGTLSIAAIAVLYRYADVLGDGNIEKEDR